MGRGFADLETVNQWLAETWCPKISDKRPLKLGDNLPKTPAERFLLEAKDLQELKFHTPSMREEKRHVDKRSLVQVDGKLYRVPEIARNKDVQILIDDRTITVLLKGEVIANLDKVHSVYTSRLQSLEEARPKMELRFERQRKAALPPSGNSGGTDDTPNPIGRPMADYEKALGGNWNEPSAKNLDDRSGTGSINKTNSTDNTDNLTNTEEPNKANDADDTNDAGFINKTGGTDNIDNLTNTEDPNKHHEGSPSPA